jgi:hypothetical protein
VEKGEAQGGDRVIRRMLRGRRRRRGERVIRNVGVEVKVVVEAEVMFGWDWD